MVGRRRLLLGIAVVMIAVGVVMTLRHPATTSKSEPPPATTAAPAVPANVEAPKPFMPAGAHGGYQVRVESPAEWHGPVPLQVITSTNPGTFAVTGFVLDQKTRRGVAGAAIALSDGVHVYSNTTDAKGGYAYVHIPPAGGVWTLTVVAKGYGVLLQKGMTFKAGNTGLIRSALNDKNQFFSQTPNIG